jgi:putative Holliday junction resolvase
VTVLGIDYGLKRVGVALAESGERPRRLAVIPAPNCQVRLIELIKKYGVTELVVGLPRNLDGDDTPQTVAARLFAKELEDRVLLPVTLQDEADTSNLARERLAGEGLKMLEIERQLDAEAAVIIVEDYLHER